MDKLASRIKRTTLSVYNTVLVSLYWLLLEVLPDSSVTCNIKTGIMDKNIYKDI